MTSYTRATDLEHRHRVSFTAGQLLHLLNWLLGCRHR